MKTPNSKELTYFTIPPETKLTPYNTPAPGKEIKLWFILTAPKTRKLQNFELKTTTFPQTQPNKAPNENLPKRYQEQAIPPTLQNLLKTQLKINANFTANKNHSTFDHNLDYYDWIQMLITNQISKTQLTLEHYHNYLIFRNIPTEKQKQIIPLFKPSFSNEHETINMINQSIINNKTHFQKIFVMVETPKNTHHDKNIDNIRDIQYSPFLNRNLNSYPTCTDIHIIPETIKLGKPQENNTLSFNHPHNKRYLILEFSKDYQTKQKNSTEHRIHNLPSNSTSKKRKPQLTPPITLDQAVLIASTP